MRRLSRLLGRAAQRAVRPLGFRVVPNAMVRSTAADQRALLRGVEAPVIVDLGANRGSTIKRYLDHFPGAQVHGFEPLPDAARALRQRFAAAKNVIIVEKAVGAESGTATFYVNPADVQSSLLPISEIGSASYIPHKRSIEVDVVTLGEYCARNGVPHIDILKMDVQGAEVMALQGARKLLAEGVISVLYFEAWFKPFYEGGALFFDAAELVRADGYSLFGIYHLKHDSNAQLIKADVIFVSPSIQAGLDSVRPFWHSRGRREAGAASPQF